jgi:hypothetical protein
MSSFPRTGSLLREVRHMGGRYPLLGWLHCTIFVEIGRNRDSKKSISACAKAL